MFTPEQKQLIAKALFERIGGYSCPICHGEAFTIINGILSDEIIRAKSNKDDNKILPSIAVICDNCGFMSKHNLMVLGIPEKIFSKNIGGS